MSFAIWFLPHGECPRRAVSKGGAFGRSPQGAKSPVFDLLGSGGLHRGDYDTPLCVPCSDNFSKEKNGLITGSTAFIIVGTRYKAKKVCSDNLLRSILRIC